MRAHDAVGRLGRRPALAIPPPPGRDRGRTPWRTGLAVTVMIERVSHIGQRHCLHRHRPSTPPAHRPSTQSAPVSCPTPPACVTAGSGPLTTDSAAGACSITTCALVPPNPNEDTPARRGRSTDGHSCCSATTFSRIWSNAICGLGVWKCRFCRDTPPLHRQHRFDETRHTGRRLEMAQIRLDRTNQQRRLLRTPTAQDRAERTRLDGIPQQGSGAMGLDIVHFMRRHPRIGVRRAQHRHLSGWIRSQQAVGPAVLVDGRTAHHRQQPIPVAQCITQPLEHHHPAALAADEPIGVRVERMARTGRRQRTGLIETTKNRRRQQQIHSARNGHIESCIRRL